MKYFFWTIAFLQVFNIAAEVAINIESTPEMPLKNYLRNNNFKDGLKFWKQTIRNCARVEKGILKIKGNEKENCGVFQKVVFPEAVPKGASLYVEIETSAQGTDNEFKRPAISILARCKDGSNLYLPSPDIPNEPHEWIKASKVIELKKTISSLVLYICYYKQIGSLAVRSIKLKYASSKVNINVSGNYKKVKVFNSRLGIIDECDQANYKKGFRIVPGSAYFVEVLGKDNILYTKRYPENAFVPKTSTEKSLSIFKRFVTAVIKPGRSEKFNFDINRKYDKAVLNFDVRLANRKIIKVSGYTHALKLKLNGHVITPAILLERTEKFTRMDGFEANIYGSAFLVYYSPWVYSLSENDDYCPLKKINRNPFVYKFNVESLLKQGKNTLEVSNSAASSNPPYLMYLHDAKILLK